MARKCGAATRRSAVCALVVRTGRNTIAQWPSLALLDDLAAPDFHDAVSHCVCRFPPRGLHETSGRNVENRKPQVDGGLFDPAAVFTA